MGDGLPFPTSGPRPQEAGFDRRSGSMTEALGRLGVIPVVVIRDPLRAAPLAHALVDGDLPCVEITLRTPGAMEALRRIAGEVPELLLGAGTVLTAEQALDAIDAGARFIVSPGFSPRVVECCRSRGIPVYPGACTPSDVMLALEQGLETVKFFPAEPMGGTAFLRSIAAPFPGLGWIPTGGIGLAQLPEYLGIREVVACGGSWIAPARWIESDDFERIRIEAHRAVTAVRNARPPDPGPDSGRDPAKRPTHEA